MKRAARARSFARALPLAAAAFLLRASSFLRLAALPALAAVASLSLACAADAPASAPPQAEPGYFTQQTIDRSLTIDDVHVSLSRITHSATHLSVEYSYSSNIREVEPKQMINGISLTRADGSVALSDSGVGGEVFPLDSRVPGGEGELVDVSLGTYLIPANVSGSVTIDLGTAYKTAMEDPADDGPTIVPLSSDFSIGDRKYRVTQMLVFPINFRLWVEPVNEAARRTDLIAEEVTLTDNTGNPYEYAGGDTSFDNLTPRGHDWRQFIFAGILPEDKTSLTMGIRGGETIVGPFVFEDVRVVSDDAPAAPPQAPGGPTEGTAAPASATE